MTTLFEESDLDLEAFRQKLSRRARFVLGRYNSVKREISHEDLIQETITRLAEYDLEEIDSLYSLASTIMHHYAHDRVQRLNREPSRDDMRDDELSDRDLIQTVQFVEHLPPNPDELREYGLEWRRQAEEIATHWPDNPRNNYFGALLVTIRQNTCIGLAKQMVDDSFTSWGALHELVVTLYPWNDSTEVAREDWHTLKLKNHEDWPELGEVWGRLWEVFTDDPSNMTTPRCASIISDLVAGEGGMTTSNWHKWSERGRSTLEEAWENSGLEDDELSFLWENRRIRESPSQS